MKCARERCPNTPATATPSAPGGAVTGYHCPVCLRAIGSTQLNNIRLHLDRANRLCPASGQPFHITAIGEGSE